MPSWRDNLRRGSFRGIAFFCRDVQNDAGQRLAVFEQPDSDTPFIQPLGRGVKEYRLEIYVAGDDYMTARDALEAALDADGPGTLVHPYKGELQVYARHPCRLRELSMQGRAAFFDVTFVEAGGPSPPVQAPDTAGTAQDAAAASQALIAAAYVPLYDGEPAPVQSAFTQALAAVQSAISAALSFPAAAAQLVQDLAALAAVAPDSPVAYAAALATLLGDYVANIVASFTPAVDATLAPGFQDSSRLPPLPGDPSYGLGTLGAIGATLIPPYASGTVLANWTALADLVEGSATAALVDLWAQTDFASAADAGAARAQIHILAVAQIEAAQGNDPLVQAWRGILTAAVADLTARAAAVPEVATLTTLAPLPALVLAQQIYQDGTQAAALVQRNSIAHPLFCPLTVEFLAP